MSGQENVIIEMSNISKNPDQSTSRAPPQEPSNQEKVAEEEKQVSVTSHEGADLRKRLLFEAMLKQSSVALVFIIGIVIVSNKQFNYN